MPTRQEIAKATARLLAGANLQQFPAVMGFDGFVDDIIDVVQERASVDSYTRLPTMAQLAQIISDSVNRSCNMELVVKKQKLGGNGPIMASALASLGLPMTYMGTVGDLADPTGIHHVFHDFAKRATLIPLTSPAITHALEFNDGKVMLGELAPCARVSWARILEVVGREKLTAFFEQSAFLGIVKWTMLPAHDRPLAAHLADEILPKLSNKPRRIFLDRADPTNRSQSDIQSALAVLKKLNALAPVCLGLNFSEAEQIAAALAIKSADFPLPQLAEQIRAKSNHDTIVIHPTERAAAANAAGSAEFRGPFVKEPKILTGAGDHFNAGFAAALLLNFPLENALAMATAISGFYVRNAHSPSAAELATFLEFLPDPQ